MLKPHKHKNRIIHGPDISIPFTVNQGVAVIMTGRTGFPLATGCTWPGHHLPPELWAHLHPDSVQLLPETELEFSVNEADLRAGTATVRVVAMLSGSLTQRIKALPEGSLETTNKSTIAAALNMTREALITANNRRKNSEGALPDVFEEHL